MTKAFIGRFITNSQRPKGMDSLMTMKLGNNESIKDYSARFWETYNDIDGCGEDTAVQTFKLGLPPSTGLRQSLTKCPSASLRKLMDRIEQFIRVEEDGGNATVAQLAQKPKPDQVSICILPRGVCTLHGCVHHFNMLIMVSAPQGCVHHFKEVYASSQVAYARLSHPKTHSFSILVSINHIGGQTMVS
jgi:hypothetical protein